MQNIILEAIKKRRSIREFTPESVDRDALYAIITAGIRAPSGKNNQPWRFVIVYDKDIKNRLAGQTLYKHIVIAAPVLIAVYLDSDAMYDTAKDHQSAGACIENMLLAAESLGLGGVWLGQIRNNRENVNRILDISERYELVAVVAIGHPAHRNQQSHRKSLPEFILKEFGGTQ